jgi:hypothetical protein
VMICGRVVIGRDIMGIEVDARSCETTSQTTSTSKHNSGRPSRTPPHLLKKIRRQHENFRVGSKALGSTEISNPLLVVLG